MNETMVTKAGGEENEKQSELNLEKGEEGKKNYSETKKD